MCARSFTNQGYASGSLASLWSRDLENEWSAHYMRFYTPEEEDRFRGQESVDDYFAREQFSMNRVWPLLKEVREATGGPPRRRSADSECEGEENEENALGSAFFGRSSSPSDYEDLDSAGDEDACTDEVDEDDAWASM